MARRALALATCLARLAGAAEPVRAPAVPAVSASSAEKGAEPRLAFDGDRATAWRASTAGASWLRLDFPREREMGGLALRFEPGFAARDFAVEASRDGDRWIALRTVRGNGRDTSRLALPELSSGVRFGGAASTPEIPRHLRVLFAAGARAVGVSELEPLPPSFGESPDELVLATAREAPRGRWPRAYAGEQTYWTVAGVEGTDEEALVSEDGALEPGRGSFSLEPFLLVDGELLDWSRVSVDQTLAEGDLPIPSVSWSSRDVTLTVTTLVDGAPGASTLLARYRLGNLGGRAETVRLFVAVRPLLVSPPSPLLDAPHGVSRIGRIAWEGGAARVEGVPTNAASRNEPRAWTVAPSPLPNAFGALAWDSGDLTEFLARGTVPAAAAVEDPAGLAAAALGWELVIPPGFARDVILTVPLEAGASAAPVEPPAFEARRLAAARDWREKLSRVAFTLPPAAAPLGATLRSNLAYVLVSRGGPRVQPGSRAYERSWICDGALTSSALLRLGHADAARDVLVWSAGQPSGMEPCGELLLLAAEVWRFTHDAATLEAVWPQVEKAVAYIDTQRKQRLTPEYDAPAKRAYRGLLPGSIGHEGGSGRAVHSYRDDFIALRGLKDAVELAGALGRTDAAARWADIRDAFRSDLHASLRATIAESEIDTIPGSVEKHDFDPASTAIALSPGGEGSRLPRRELERTFARYVAESRARRDGKRKSDAYTPHEWRAVGSLVRLGRRAEAQETIAFLMNDRRPRGWNQWAEVAGADPRAPRFVGDMPNTSVGTDFIRSFLDLFGYEREDDRALVVGAGLSAAWLRAEGGAAVKGFRTAYGTFDLAFSAAGNDERVRIAGERVPEGGVAVRLPACETAREATVNGRAVPVSGGEVLVRALPADVVVRR